MATKQSLKFDSSTETTTNARTLSMDEQQSLEEKMPDSIKGFTTALGRTFECPECNEPTNGECDNCGYTHPNHREDLR